MSCPHRLPPAQMWRTSAPRRRRRPLGSSAAIIVLRLKAAVQMAAALSLRFDNSTVLVWKHSWGRRQVHDTEPRLAQGEKQFQATDFRGQKVARKCRLPLWLVTNGLWSVLDFLCLQREKVLGHKLIMISKCDDLNTMGGRGAEDIISFRLCRRRALMRQWESEKGRAVTLTQFFHLTKQQRATFTCPKREKENDGDAKTHLHEGQRPACTRDNWSDSTILNAQTNKNQKNDRSYLHQGWRKPNGQKTKKDSEDKVVMFSYSRKS